MKRALTLLSSVALTIASACERPVDKPASPVSATNELTIPSDLLITLVETNAYRFATHRVTLDAVGSIEWNGKPVPASQRRVSRETLHELLARFDATGFARFHDEYTVFATDLGGTTTITLRRNGVEKRVVEYGGSLFEPVNGEVDLVEPIFGFVGDRAQAQSPASPDTEPQDIREYGSAFRAITRLADAIDDAADPEALRAVSNKAGNR